jgi:hypothetical protein
MVWDAVDEVEIARIGALAIESVLTEHPVDIKEKEWLHGH